METLSWDAYHEGVEDFKKSVEGYYQLYGYYPELVQVDQLYARREHRQCAKEKGIRIPAKALGRPKKEADKNKRKNVESAYQRQKRKKEHGESNHIEGKIGQANQGYRLKQIRAKTQETGQSWISAIIFIMNLNMFQADMKKKKKRGKYFLCFINLLVYQVVKKIYRRQNIKANPRLAYAA